MRRRIGSSFLIVTALLALVASAYPQQTGGVLADHGRTASEDGSSPGRASGLLPEIALLEQQCFDQVNRQREAHRLARLGFSDTLLDVARDYSRRMAEEHFFSHTDP